MLIKFKAFFDFEKRRATIKKEIIGAVSSFLTMCYILAVNPQILTPGFMDATNGAFKIDDPMQVSGGLFLITAIVTFVGTFLLGLLTNLPASATSSLGCNTFFSYTLTTSLGVTPNEGLLAALISSLIFFILSATNVRKYLFNNIPGVLKYAIAAAIGLYLATVGLKFMGLIGQTNKAGSIAGHPALIQSLGLGYLGNPSIYLGLIIFFGAFVLHIFKIPGSLPIAMVIGLIIGLILHAASVPNMPVWDSLLQYKERLQSLAGIKYFVGQGFMNVSGAFVKVPFYVGCVMFLLIMFFESSGASTAFISEMERVEPSAIPENKRIIFSSDSGTSIVGSVLGMTPAVMAVSTAVGVAQGARTGFAGILISFFFLVAIPLYPVFYMFFPYANEMTGVADKMGLDPSDLAHVQFGPITGAALMFAGFSMFSGLRNVDMKKVENVFPTFFLILVMILSASIPNGIAFGFFSYVFINLCLKRFKEINGVTYGSTAILIIYFIILILLDVGVIHS